MKKSMLIPRIVIVVLAALIIGACNRGGMMESMMSDPAMMNQMMEQMMSDPKMVEQMTDYMTKHSDTMASHMQSMMGNAEHRRAMVEMMRRNPALREQMQAILSESQSPAGTLMK